MILVLDKGIITYLVQFPGEEPSVDLMPRDSNEFLLAPFYVNLVIRDEGLFSLNRFFITLLSQLTFFPRRLSTPPFEVILEGAGKRGTCVTGYQYNKDRRLVPSPPSAYQENILTPPSLIRFQGDNGDELGTMQVEINANKHSFFKHVIEQRAAQESDQALRYWLKILANSGSYGLFVELNPNEAHNAPLRVFSGEESFETTSDVIEEPGNFFAPHIASPITAGGRLLLAMLEKCIVDAGGTYLFCDTDSAAIVLTEHRQRIAMPDGAEPITALSRDEVDEIVQRFERLNPYNLKGSILKVHKLNWDENEQRRQLYGYSIAAKRYALYTKTKDDIKIVEPKAHGLGYFYPPKDSPDGWEHETPQWIFEAWDWIMRGVLGLKRRKPPWFGLPVMMKLTLSTPHHALKNLAKGPLTRPNNFMMIPQIQRFGYPQDVDPNKCTFITSFSSKRDQWMRSKCINVRDPQSRVYELTDEHDGRCAVPKNFFMLLESYQNHPEAKSLGPDGKPCTPETRGLLQRAHIVANWPPIYIGKEHDRHSEEGEDSSLLEFKTIEYKRKGYAVATDEQLHRIAKVPKRELMRRGISQHTLEKICKRQPVRAIKLFHCIRQVENSKRV